MSAGPDIAPSHRPPEILPAEPFDIEAMNREFAVAMIGQKCLIIREDEGAPPDRRHHLLSADAFKLWMQNRTTMEWNEREEKWRRVPLSARWLKDPERRAYVGIVFEPGDDADTRDSYNLWAGFDVEPSPAGDYSPFTEHLYMNICSEREEIFDYVMAWFAHMVQRPRERIGTAIAFRGGQGTGKTMIGKIVGSLIDAHYLLIDDPRYLLGQFNAHLAQTLLLQADEAFWSGDKAGVGHLKGLITSDTQMIEHKGVDAIRVRNYLRLMVTSNEDWVVPAGRDERRWLVVDVSSERAQDEVYFGRLNDHFFGPKEGPANRAALLHHLMNLDISRVRLRSPPRTTALFEQKVRSLGPIESWWLDRLMEGGNLPGEGWIDKVPIFRVRASYDAACERLGQRHRGSDTEFGIALKRLVPGLQRGKCYASDGADDGPNASQKRVNAYVFPPLDACRAAFVERVGQVVEWPRHE